MFRSSLSGVACVAHQTPSTVTHNHEKENDMAKKSAAETIAVKEENRAKALERFLAEQNKKSPGEVMRLSDDSAFSDVDAIPTGAISLDVALGCGGFPKGRVIEVFGPEMSGKCLTADTHVWSDHGLETIAELFARCGEQTDDAVKATDITHLNVRLVNEYGELEPVAALTHNGARPVRRLVLESGRHVDATHNHPLRVLTARGAIAWKNVGDIATGDLVVSATFGSVESGGGTYLSTDEASTLGYMTADIAVPGSVTVARDTYLKLLRQVIVEHSWQDDDAMDVFDEEECVQYLAAKNTGGNIDPYTVAVPHSVRTADSKTVAAFLAAVYEKGGRNVDGRVTLTSTSALFAEQIQLLLYGLGIPATLDAERDQQANIAAWTVTVNKKSVARFETVIKGRTDRSDGAGSGELFEQVANLHGLLGELVEQCSDDSEIAALYADIVATSGSDRISRTDIERILTWAERATFGAYAGGIVDNLKDLIRVPYTFEKVVGTSELGVVATFDVVVPGTHSFIANGVLSHNTSLALSVAANVQKAGGNVGFVDAEHALNRQHAIDMGVNPDMMLITQPSSGEKAIEMVLDMVKSGAFDMVIVDSVAALTPQSEIDGDIDSERPGVHAKLMSRFMRLATGPCADNNTMLVLINQIRSSLSSYGNPEVTTGGKAIKFYASVRIEVRSAASKKIERNKQVVGQTCVASVRKNKVGPPHRVAEYDLYFGQGISGESSLLDVAEAVGLVMRNGASYTEVLTSLKLGVGKETVKQKLAEDAELRERLTKAVYDTLRKETAAFVPEPGSGLDDELDEDELDDEVV
jgi:protein RecA